MNDERIGNQLSATSAFLIIHDSVVALHIANAILLAIGIRDSNASILSANMSECTSIQFISRFMAIGHS